MVGAANSINEATTGFCRFSGTAFDAVPLTANGQLIIGSGVNTGAAATLTAGAGISITNASNSITIAATGGGGTVIQQVRTSTATLVNSSGTTIPFDDTIPQNSEGTELFTLAITPSNANSVLIFEFSCDASGNGDQGITALFQDSTANALYANAGTQMAADNMFTCSWIYYMTAGTTSSTTFKIRYGGQTDTMYINGTYNVVSGARRKFGAVSAAVLTITEFSS